VGEGGGHPERSLRGTGGRGRDHAARLGEAALLLQPQKDPRGSVGNRRRPIPGGSRHVGKVVRLAVFGAFVSLGGGVDGLLHISKIGGGKRIKSAGESSAWDRRSR